MVSGPEDAFTTPEMSARTRVKRAAPSEAIEPAVEGAVPRGVAAEEAQGVEVGESGGVGREQQWRVGGDQPGPDGSLVEEFRRPGDDQAELLAARS